MRMISLNDDNFPSEVLEAKELVYVDFWGTWCVPCKQLPPILEELASEYPGQLKIGEYNIEKSKEYASKYRVLSVPVVILFKGGNAVETIVAVHPKEHYKKILDRHL